MATPSTPPAPRTLPALPTAKAPSLRNFVVTVPARQPTLEELLGKLDDLLRELADVREREPGEPIQMGDDVHLDVIGFCGGRLIPHSARSGQGLVLARIRGLPGFAEALVGTPVGTVRSFQLTMPQDYPARSLRGKEATFEVAVRRARQVVTLDPESPELLRRAGRGDTLEALMQSLGKELVQDLSRDQLEDARERILDELVRRTEVSVPAALVDEEIRRAWSKHEAPLLVARRCLAAELSAALDGWTRDELTRVQVERRLRVGLALKAICERDGVRLPPWQLRETFETWVRGRDLPFERALAEVATDPARSAAARETGWHLAAFSHLMKMVQVRFEGVPLATA